MGLRQDTKIALNNAESNLYNLELTANRIERDVKNSLDVIVTSIVALTALGVFYLSMKIVKEWTS